MTEPVCFGIVAGERSGDVLGAGLIRALREIFPAASFVGVGGPSMLDEGCESLAPMDRLSVMGFVEPLGRLPELLAIKRKLERRFIDNPPLAFIGVDYPDFNLLLEKKLRQHGIPTVHYVSPSVWAYRQKRIFKIKAAVDLMLTLFPFETPIFERYRIRVSCVGHPLADEIGFEDRRQFHRQELGLASGDPVLALMPGSRGGEIKRLGPVFLAAAMAVLQEWPDMKFLMPYSGKEARARLEQLLRANSIMGDDQFILVNDSHAALSAADLALMCSGTATLEAMLLRRPMIVCYKLAPLSHAIASRLVKIPHFSLPNLLAGQSLVPEYKQDEVRASRLAQDIIQFFRDRGSQQGMLEEFDRLHRNLRQGGSAKAAAAIAELVADEYAH